MTGWEADVVLKILHTADWHLGLRFPGLAREDAQKLLMEAGLLVAFVVDGDCEPVREAHADLVRALLAGRLYPKQVEALEDALRAHAAELAAFAG